MYVSFLNVMIGTRGKKLKAEDILRSNKIILKISRNM